MNHVSLALSVFLLPVVSGTVAAQRDIIELHDGTVLRNVKVISWNAKEIRFKAKSGDDMRAAHLVKSVKCAQVVDALRNAAGSAEALVGEAEASKDPLVASSAYYKAAMLYFDAGETSSMLSALQIIDQKYPDSAHAPDYYRWKIRYYLTKDKPDFKSAAVTAEKYGDASRTRTWSNAYQYDAEYWTRRAEFAGGKVKPDFFISAMREIIGKTSAEAPFVAHAAAVDLADAYRGQKNYKDALAEYTKLLEMKGLPADVRARMFLGLGYISLEDAVESQKKSDYHEAYKNFLKVYLNAKDASPSLVAEGLYNAAKACDQWGELPTCKEMAARLRGRLKYRDPYKDTKWAKKKG